MMEVLFIIKAVCMLIMLVHALTLKSEIKEDNSVEKNLAIGLKGIVFSLIMIAVFVM